MSELFPAPDELPLGQRIVEFLVGLFAWGIAITIVVAFCALAFIGVLTVWSHFHA